MPAAAQSSRRARAAVYQGQRASLGTAGGATCTACFAPIRWRTVTGMSALIMLPLTCRGGKCWAGLRGGRSAGPRDGANVPPERYGARCVTNEKWAAAAPSGPGRYAAPR